MKNRHASRGSVILALIALIFIAGIGAYWLKRSMNHKEISQADWQHRDLAVKAQTTLQETKKELGNFIRINRIKVYRDNNCQGTNPPPVCSTLTMTPSDLHAAVTEAPGESLSIECAYQGATKQPCNASHLIFPKVFHLRLMKWNSDRRIAIDIQQELQIAPAKLNDYAYLVMRETSDLVSLAGGHFGGKVSILFDRTPVSGNPTDDPLVDDPSDPYDQFKTIRLMNPRDPQWGGPKELVFDELFSTNIPVNQIQLGIPNPYSTNNPPDPYYAVEPADFKKGVWPSAEAPQDLLGDFVALRDNPNTIKYAGANLPRNAKVEFGSPTNPCAFRIKVEVYQNNCYQPGQSIFDDGGGGYRTNQKSFQIPPDGVTDPKRLMSTYRGFETRRTSGGGSGSYANPCTPGYIWQDLPYGSSPDGKVFYVNALNSIKVTSYGDQAIDKVASVCGKYTVLFGKDAQIAKSIERQAPLGGSISNSNVALVNLGGSNYINGSTIPMNSGIPTLNQLKQNCSLIGCQNQESVKLEVSLISVQQGGNALRVDPNLIDPANFGELGILHTYGTFVTDKLANNRTLTVNGSGSALTISGFSDVRYEYNPDVQNNPPPGLAATSASFDWEMSETAVSTTFTEGGEALLWASAP